MITDVVEDTNLENKKDYPVISNRLSLKDIMAMNRRDRRRLAKFNNVGKIPGSNKPYLTKATRDRLGIFDV